MANIGSVVVQFIAKDMMGNTLGKIKRSLTDTEDAAGKTKRSWGKLSAAWSASLPVAGAVIAAGVGVANVLIDAARAGLEDKRSADLLAASLRRIPGITEEAIAANEEWISGMQLATLVADTDLREAVGALTRATGDLGSAQKLTAIAVDASTQSGKSLTTVTEALAKAADGNTQSLKRMFPWLDKNKDGTLTYAEAVEGLDSKFKGAAREAAKTKVWETLGTIWGELQEALAGVLLPLLEKFSDWFSSERNRRVVQDFIEKVAELALQLGTKLVRAIDSAVDWLKKPENQRKIQEWINKFQQLARFIGSCISAIETFIAWVRRIPDPTKILGGWRGGIGSLFGKSAPAAAPGYGSARSLRAPAPTVTAHPTAVLVTEEQVYRAVARLMLRGDARNGRLARVG